MRVVHEARGETLAPTGFGLPGRFSSGVRIGPPPFGLEPLLTDVRGFHPYSRKKHTFIERLFQTTACSEGFQIMIAFAR